MIRRRIALALAAVLWFALWAYPSPPAVPTRAVVGRPCLLAEVRHPGSGWSSPMALRETRDRMDRRLLGTVGDPTPSPFAIRLARLDTPDVPELIRCVASALGVDVATALNVAACESHFDPQARNGSYIGVYQIHEDLFHARAMALGLAGADPTDAWSNVWVALNIVRQEGWGRWVCR